jgi:hypothetical protein
MSKCVHCGRETGREPTLTSSGYVMVWCLTDTAECMRLMMEREAQG